ncbi:tRNA methyltransferase, partial [Candidatus Bathyarchaeota archaeon]|nr:tRNA methyltransferase [Candidatus Bathyarchaeota archaeon]
MPSGEKIRDGDYVLLYSDRKKWLTRVEPRQFHTHKGIIDLESVVGKSYGERIKSTLNYDFVLLKPLIVDYISNIPRL